MAEATSLFNRMLDDAVDAARFGRSLLVQAAKRGHDDVLRCILHRASATADFSEELSDAFLGAAGQGQLSCLSAILESGHDINVLTTAQTEDGETALLLAAKQGNVACVTRLLQHNPEAQVAAVDSAGTTALISAARHGHAACVHLLLQHNPEAQVAAANGNGTTALIVATYHGHAECVQHLLQHTPEAQLAATNSDGDDSDGDTALSVAARYGHPLCLELLLTHKIQQKHLDHAWLLALRGWSATDACTPHALSQCLQMLLAKGGRLPRGTSQADHAKRDLFIQDFASRALVADGTIVGPPLTVSNKRKAGQEEQ